MKKEISIHIPTLCHKDWQQMTPTDKGRFCQSCAKQVVDFSTMNDQQVLNYITKAAAGRVCGRFAGDQLQRPLQPTKPEKKKIWWVAAAVPLLMVFGKAAGQKKINTKKTCGSIIKLDQASMSLGIVVFESSKTNNDNEDADTDKPSTPVAPFFNHTITVWKNKDQGNFTITGKIEEAKSNEPIPFATIIIKGTKTAAAADGDGNFTLATNLPGNHFVLSISAVGYLETEVSVMVRDTEEIKENPPISIQGRVVDMAGTAIPFASIHAKKSKQSLNTDGNGRFVLALPASCPTDILAISSVGFDEKQVQVSAKDTGEVTIRCNALTLGLTETVVTSGKVLHCEKVKKTDTIPTLVRKIFNAEAFKIYPNPTQSGQTITIDTKKQGEYSIQLFDNSGKLLQVKEFNAVEGATQTSFTLPATIASGMYYIRVVDEKIKKQYTDKIVVR